MNDIACSHKNQADICHDENQEILLDIHPKTGKVNQWARKKAQTNLLAASHQRISSIDPDFENRSARLLECGRWLEFKKYVETGQKTLNRANFCKYRLCPMCSWRRSLKTFGQTSKIMDEAEKQGYAFVFVTLTIKNCFKSELSRTLDHLYQSLTRFDRLKAVKNAVCGHMEVIEITHNVDKKSDSYDTFHPHIHAIWAVKPSYFTSKDYISKSKLIEIWRESLQVAYDPSVSIDRANTANKGHIREVSKYMVKPGEILQEDPDLTDSVVWSLDRALFNRRMVFYKGILKQIRASFHFDDPETGDLVHVDGEEVENPDLKFILEKYAWHVGYKQYSRIS